MSSIGVLRDLAEIFLPIGFAGAAIAVVCAILAAVALARGAAGLAGGAVGCWIVGGMLSLTAGFAGQWLPVMVAGGALITGLVLGAVTRAVVRRLPARPTPVQTAAGIDTAPVTRPRPVVLTPASQR